MYVYTFKFGSCADDKYCNFNIDSVIHVLEYSTYIIRHSLFYHDFIQYQSISL